jgi:hypothetical protein
MLHAVAGCGPSSSVLRDHEFSVAFPLKISSNKYNKCVRAATVGIQPYGTVSLLQCQGPVQAGWRCDTGRAAWASCAFQMLPVLPDSLISLINDYFHVHIDGHKIFSHPLDGS